jgi:hypothetical protein
MIGVGIMIACSQLQRHLKRARTVTMSLAKRQGLSLVTLFRRPEATHCGGGAGFGFWGVLEEDKLC